MIEHLYSTPLYYNAVNDYKTINYHIDKIIDKVDFKTGVWGATHAISTDFGELSTPNHILKKFGLRKLEKEIHKHLEEYCDELGFKMPSYRCLSWFSKFEKGNYAHIHHHGHHDISGVYYYKTNGEDGKIFFETPNPFLDTQLCYRSYGETWEHKPQEGKILLFPGWLRHGVRTNETDNTRISLSFNIYFNHSLI